MRVTKHYECDSIILYFEENGLCNCILLENEKQMRRLGECLIDLERTGSKEVEIKPRC